MTHEWPCDFGLLARLTMLEIPAHISLIAAVSNRVRDEFPASRFGPSTDRAVVAATRVAVAAVVPMSNVALHNSRSGMHEPAGSRLPPRFSE